MRDKVATASCDNITHSKQHLYKPEHFFISGVICTFCPCKCKLPSLPLGFFLCNSYQWKVITALSSTIQRLPGC